MASLIQNKFSVLDSDIPSSYYNSDADSDSDYGLDDLIKCLEEDEKIIDQLKKMNTKPLVIKKPIIEKKTYASVLTTKKPEIISITPLTEDPINSTNSCKSCVTPNISDYDATKISQKIIIDKISIPTTPRMRQLSFDNGLDSCITPCGVKQPEVITFKTRPIVSYSSDSEYESCGWGDYTTDEE